VWIPKKYLACCADKNAMNHLTNFLIFSGIHASLAFADTSILFIADAESNFQAGSNTLARHLRASGLGITAEVSLGWPADAAKIAAADSIVIFGRGRENHVANGHSTILRQHMGAGKGLAVLNFALEPGDADLTTLLDDAIGGHFDPAWSVNAVWEMKNPIVAKHAVTQDFAAFEIKDEFPYHLRLRPEVIPLLQALPPEDSLGIDGPRSGNDAARKAIADKLPQTLAWVIENPDKSRGFGFTGGHHPQNWLDASFRKLVLNGIAWTARIDIPETGITATSSFKTIDETIARGTADDVGLFIELHPENLKKGARETSRSPLEQAVLRNKPETAILLLESGANPNVADPSKRTPLHIAIERKNLQILEALLKAGANPNLGDKAGWTPLHHAAAKNQPEAAKALLAADADPTILSELGGTPLHEAAASGGAEIIKILLATKIDPSLKSKQDVTALDLAKEYKNQPAIEILEAIK